MSNRDRIERMRAEAEAKERENEEKRKEPAARPKRAAAGGDARRKLVWAVKDPRGEILATFPYGRKELAKADARRRGEADGRSYIVTPERVPFDGG